MEGDRDRMNYSLENDIFCIRIIRTLYRLLAALPLQLLYMIEGKQYWYEMRQRTMMRNKNILHLNKQQQERQLRIFRISQCVFVCGT